MVKVLREAWMSQQCASIPMGRVPVSALLCGWAEYVARVSLRVSCAGSHTGHALRL
jgi:hypothetical protein